jgi:hypothetical protein
MACHKTSTPYSFQVREIGLLETSTAFKGRDGGFSGLFQGRSVWIYGDTVLAFAGEDKSSWRHNSWSWTANLNAKEGKITGFQERVDALSAPTEFFAPTAEEAAFNKAHAGDPCQKKPCGARKVLWPGAIIEDRAHQRAFIFYTKIYGERGAWNFRALGHSVAVWSDFSKPPQRPLVRPQHSEPTLLFDAHEPNFGGSGAILVGDMLYAYGCEKSGGFVKPCRLGRVPVNDVSKREVWRFYTQNGDWSEKLDNLRVLFDGAPMMTVHWNYYLGAYLAIYSKPMDRRIAMRTAVKPEGPWSDETILWKGQNSHDGETPYSGLGHPEFAKDGGRIEYVTYYRSPADWKGEIRLLEITFARTMSSS